MIPISTILRDQHRLTLKAQRRISGDETYLTGWATGERDGEHWHIIWQEEPGTDRPEIVALDPFPHGVTFSSIRFTQDVDVFVVLRKMLTATCKRVRCYYADRGRAFDEQEVIDGYAVEFYVCCYRSKPGHNHVHYGNFMSDASCCYSGFEFLLDGKWVQSYGSFAASYDEVLRIMLQATGLPKFQNYSEDDFPNRCYPDLDLENFIGQLCFDIFCEVFTPQSTPLIQDFISRALKELDAITEPDKRDFYYDKTSYLCFSFFEMRWHEDLSLAMAAFCNKDPKAFDLVRRALNSMRCYDLTDADRRRFQLPAYDEITGRPL